MALQIDISKNKILGPVYRRGIQKGMQEGREEGERAVLRHQLTKRFGRLPAWATLRLSEKSGKELKQLAEQLLDAHSLKELLQ